MNTKKHGLTQGERGWYKRVNGKPKWIVSLKICPTPEEADDYYQTHFSDLWQPVVVDKIDLGSLAGLYIERQEKRRDTGAIKPRTFQEIEEAIQKLVDLVGDTRMADELTPADFAAVRDSMDAQFGPARLAKFIILMRSFLKWANSRKLITAPDYGGEFSIPSKAAFRQVKRQWRMDHGALDFSPVEVWKILAAANEKMAAMTLLGLIGFGNADIAELPCSVVDLKHGVIDYARGKTGIERRVILWPEHIPLLVPFVKKTGLVFTTRYGKSFVDGSKNQVTHRFGALLEKVGFARNGRNFYSLRRTFRTVADAHPDQRAVALMMGHEIGDVGGLYVQKITDDRLRSVSLFARQKILYDLPTDAQQRSDSPADAAGEPQPRE